MGWGSNSPLFAPAELEALGYYSSVCSKVSCPSGDALRHSVDCDVSCAASIAGLLNGRRPSAVFRGVIAVIVDSVNRLPWLGLTQIGKKCSGVIAPAFADFNAAPTISRVLPVIWVVASSKHVIPGGVFLSSGYAVGASPVAKFFGPNATTRSADAAPKVLSKNDALVAAIASAIPCSLFVAWSASGNNQQFPKTLASQINKFRHFVTSIMASNHCKTRSNRVIEVPLSAAKPSYAGGF